VNPAFKAAIQIKLLWLIVGYFVMKTQRYIDKNVGEYEFTRALSGKGRSPGDGGC